LNKLSVAIPVYKRPDLLNKCLEALVIQCKLFSVPIYIYDDSCSTINNWVYTKFNQIYDKIFIIINELNIGIDNNINQCVNKASTQYVWLVGEDDIIEEQAISNILNLINNFSPKYIFTNYQYISNDYQHKLHVAVDLKNIEKLNANEFFQTYGWAVGFLGSNIINTNYWDKEDTKYLGTYFNHVGKIFSKLNLNDNIYVIENPSIYNRAENLESFSWFKDCFEVTYGFKSMLDILSLNQPEWKNSALIAYKNFRIRINLNSTKTLLLLRAHKIYNYEKYKKYTSFNKISFLKFTISIFPPQPLFFLLKLYKYFKK
jgi:abequosyltransferase